MPTDTHTDDGYRRPWWELSWDEFDAMRTATAKRLAVAESHLAALQTVLDLRDRFPESTTPADACERDGETPR